MIVDDTEVQAYATQHTSEQLGRSGPTDDQDYAWYEVYSLVLRSLLVEVAYGLIKSDPNK
jgi:hypothetical protein